MNRNEFISGLKEELKGLPQREIDKTLEYYEELIADRIEDGMSEQEAVGTLDAASKIREQLIEEMPLKLIVKDSIDKRGKLGTFTIILLILGSPIWISLLAAFAAVALALFIVFWTIVGVLWVVVGTLWITMAALGICAVALPVFSVIGFVTCEYITALVLLGSALACGGAGILLFFAAFYATKGMAKLTAFLAKQQTKMLKSFFTKRGEQTK